jgi:Xaa-Pro dipeptidase
MNDVEDYVKQGSEAVFPRNEIDRRIKGVQKEIAQKEFDVLLLTGPENIFYLTGQQTPGYYTFQCLVVPVTGEPFLLLRQLETINARANSYLEDIIAYSDSDNPGEVLAGLLTERGILDKRIAIDKNSWFLTVNLYDRLTQGCGELLDGTGIVELSRRVKSPLELEYLEEASRINDEGMRSGIEATAAGATENDVASAVMGAAIAAGSEYVGMEPFIVSGPRSGIPHATWRRRKIQDGDSVILETVGCYNRYHISLMRTVAIGALPSKALDMYSVCEEALSAGLEQLKPGNTCAHVHEAVQPVIDRHNYTDGYRKRSGYSLGISFAPDWGEGNILSLYHGVDVELVPGMVFHVPITLREYGKWTMAVSESAVITESGNQPLSKIKRGLIQK